ncbi:helix-turn-helix domain-containing protein [Streptomyces sp. NPDC096205]|uniref:helix-turn-helix domain-containing protein n=1 Tax=Streptomyces sp. NPDC096205 TaxID=3366081 RepID=UPI0037FDCE2B
MPDEDRLVRDGLLGLLEILAMEAQPARTGRPGTAPAPLVRDEEAGEEPDEEADAEPYKEPAQGLARDVQGLFARRRQREAGLAALMETTRELTVPYDVDEFLRVVARRARLLLNCDTSWVNLTSPAGGRSFVVTTDGRTTALTVGFSVPPAAGAGRTAAARSAPFWTPDYLADKRFPHAPALDDTIREDGLHALLAVPLKQGGTVLGTLYVADRAVRHFTPDEITLMSALGDLAALAIEKARLQELAGEAPTGSRSRGPRAGGPRAGGPRITGPRAAEGSAQAGPEELHTRLIDMVLRGCDITELAASAAAELDGALLVRDAAGRTLAVTDGFPPVEDGELYRRMLQAQEARTAVRSEGGLWVCPAVAGEEVVGTLILAPGAGLELCAPRLLEAVAQSTAVLLRLRSTASDAEGNGRDELLAELLRDPPRSLEQVQRRARRLGVDLDQPHVVLAVRPEGGPSGRALVWASSYAHRHAGLKTTDGGCLVLALPGSDPSAAGRDASDALRTALGHPVTVGSAGPVTEPGAVHRAYAEARRCLDALTALGGAGGSASPQDLGFLGLVLADNPDTAAFITDTIGPVLDYDARQDTELARTLEAYFASGGSPRRAAESLHVHPNTVSRRLERITELLGPHWQEPGRSLEVQLALRLRRTRHTVRSRQAPLAGMDERRR